MYQFTQSKFKNLIKKLQNFIKTFKKFKRNRKISTNLIRKSSIILVNFIAKKK